MTEPVDYLAHTLKAVVDRAPNLDAAEVEDVIVGCGFPEGCQGMNTARIAAMAAGFPKEVAATTVNRFCSSGSQAVMMAAHQIVNEGADVAIGAGVETITMMTDGTQNTHRLANKAARERFPGLYYPMGITAEIVAERYSVSREDQDAYGLQSQQRYAAAVEKGWIQEEIVDMQVTRKVMKKGEEPYEESFTVSADECNRPQTTLDGLAKLKPAFKEDGTVTAGNASQLSDGASSTLLMSAERAKQLGVEPLGIYRGSAVAGCGADEMGIGPVFAVPKLLKRHGITMNDVDLVELNEAFASQTLYCQRVLDILRDDGFTAHGAAAAQPEAPGQALRHRDDVHRRRPGLRLPLRSRLKPGGPVGGFAGPYRPTRHPRHAPHFDPVALRRSD
jgi:acetyl-CoA acetyltransferase family protein